MGKIKFSLAVMMLVGLMGVVQASDPHSHVVSYGAVKSALLPYSATKHVGVLSDWKERDSFMIQIGDGDYTGVAVWRGDKTGDNVGQIKLYLYCPKGNSPLSKTQINALLSLCKITGLNDKVVEKAFSDAFKKGAGSGVGDDWNVNFNYTGDLYGKKFVEVRFW